MALFPGVKELTDTPSGDPSGANEILEWDGSSWVYIATPGASGLSNVVEDTSPQLGGELDLNTWHILATNGRGMRSPVTAGQTLVLQGYDTLAAGYTNLLTIQAGNPPFLQLGPTVWPTNDGSANQVLQTDGAGNLSWATAGAGDMILASAQTNTGVKSFTDQTVKLLDTAGDHGYIFNAGGDLAADRDILLPLMTGSDTLVLNAFAATLTNKTISGADNTLTVRLANDVTGTLPIANGGTGQTTATAAFDALGPGTTKGDVIVHNGTDHIRIAVGTDAQVLTADSAEASGVKWATPAGSGDMLQATYDPAAISEQLVGLAATQTLTNKTLTTPVITLNQGTAPTPTAEGDIQWDTDDNQIKIGDGASTLTFSDDTVVQARANHTGTQTMSTISDAGALATLSTVGTTEIDNSAVTYAKVQNVNQDRILGRISVGAGIAEELTAANVRTIINVADGANNYTHPNHTGDVTSTGDGATTIADEAVTYAKMQHVSATDKVLGRATAGAGDVEEITCTSFARTLLDDATQGAAQTTLGVDPAGTDNSTDVTLAGTPDYITISGQVITRNQIDLTADVTGVLPQANGGNGIDTSAVTNGQILIGNTTGNVFALATLTGTANEIEITNGASSITIGIPNSPTLVTPTIASFTNATHDHTNAAGGGQLDHGTAITGLTDDDHTQYALLAGRSSGQTLIGGTASGENLTLQSTSNATRGTIVSVDEVEFQEGAHFGTVITNTISANAATIDLSAANHQIVDLAAATGAVTLTLTAPAGTCACTLIIKQDTTARDITWVAGTGITTGRWLGTEPTWSGDTASSYRAVSLIFDGTDVFLSAAAEQGSTF